LSSTAGEPYVRAVTGSTPAAGAIIHEVVPTNARWEILSFYALFTTSAGGSNRTPFVEFDQGAAIGVFVQPAGVPAGTTLATLTFSPSGVVTGDQVTGLFQGAFGSPMILTAGADCYMSARGLAGTDQFTTPRLQVREWLEVS